MSQNLYDVPNKQWKKWSAHAKAVFNQVYYISKENQQLFLHPEMKESFYNHWNTVAWNHAWTAAEAVDDNS